jgi:hypothetical protein
MSITDGLIFLTLAFLTGVLFKSMIEFELENNKEKLQLVPVRVRRSSWSTRDKRNR